MRRTLGLVAAAACAVLLAGCAMALDPAGSGAPPTGASPDGRFRILAGSEVKTIEPVVLRFFSERGLPAPRIEYLGAVEISNRLSSAGKIGYDAVWTANPFWIELGDTGKRVKNVKTVMKSPIVFGVKKSVANRLGWTGKPVKVADIAKAAEDGRLRFVMTSATQSNSGASAYLGFLHAFNGDRTLGVEALKDPTLRERAKGLLSRVDRSSGSSMWLSEMFLSGYDRYDAEVNYEALVIAANMSGAAKGASREPLTAVYPVDGLAIANSSLGYVDGGDAGKAETFARLQEYLLGADAQAQIRARGWRTGLGMGAEGADARVFNPAWGIDTKRTLTAVRLPKAEVIRAAFNAYQTVLRKPSLTVYCLDVSGSMGDPTPGGGTGIDQLKEAMRTLLDPEVSQRYFLQPSEADVTVVIPFSADRTIAPSRTEGNDPVALRELLDGVYQLVPGGQTDIYTPVMRGFDVIAKTPDLQDYSLSVILMTDGESNTGAVLQDLKRHVAESGVSREVPIFSIEFGNANPKQLDALAAFSRGRVFDGRVDLVRAFREAKGYN